MARIENLDKKDDKETNSENIDKGLNRKWNALSFVERRFYQDMVREISSQWEDEDNQSMCSEENEGTFILDSEDEAFKVCRQSTTIL